MKQIYSLLIILLGCTAKEHMPIPAALAGNTSLLHKIDDHAALDPAGVFVANFFAPRISPNQNLNRKNRRVYVQFTMKLMLEENKIAEDNNSVAANSPGMLPPGMFLLQMNKDGGSSVVEFSQPVKLQI